MTLTATTLVRIDFAVATLSRLSTIIRDVIDFAMMQPYKALLRQAAGKAEHIHSSIHIDLDKAIVVSRDPPQHMEDCILALKCLTRRRRS